MVLTVDRCVLCIQCVFSRAVRYESTYLTAPLGFRGLFYRELYLCLLQSTLIATTLIYENSALLGYYEVDG